MFSFRHLVLKKLFYSFIFLSAGFSFSYSAEQDKKLENIRGEIRELSKAIEQDQSYFNNLQAELAKEEKLLGEIGRELHRLESEIEHQDKQLLRLNGNKQKQLGALANTRSQLKSLVRSAYALGRQERIKLFLNQQV